MRVTREQAAKTRARIIKVASKLFRQRGYDGVGVADIMEKAGLTHGGFYGHFDSKADLAIQASSAALVENISKFADKENAADPFAALVDGYLSPAHRSNVAAGCLLAAVGSDAGRSPAGLRKVFAEGVESYIDVVTKLMPGPSTPAKREKAIATLAGLVGAMILSRAVDDPVLSDEVLRSTSRHLRAH